MSVTPGRDSVLLDAAARFGVPTVICLVILLQLNPRFDRVIDATEATNQQIALLQATCGDRPVR